MKYVNQEDGPHSKLFIQKQVDLFAELEDSVNGCRDTITGYRDSEREELTDLRSYATALKEVAGLLDVIKPKEIGTWTEQAGFKDGEDPGSFPAPIRLTDERVATAIVMLLSLLRINQTDSEIMVHYRELIKDVLDVLDPSIEGYNLEVSIRSADARLEDIRAGRV